MHSHSRETTVDVPITAAKQVFISWTQVSVEEGVDERVHERVGVAQPQQYPLQPDGGAVAEQPTDKRSCRCKEEKRQPAERKDAHDHPESGGGFLLASENGGAPAFAIQQAGQGGELLGCRGVLQSLHAESLDSVQRGLGTRQLDWGKGGEVVFGPAFAGSFENLVIHE